MSVYRQEFDLTDEDETEVVVEFDFTPGSPAITHLAPENCDPGSGPDIQILKVWRAADKHLPDPPAVTPSEADSDRIHAWIAENYEEEDDYDPDYGRD